MSTINKLISREILDSRGNPTIEVDAILSDGTYGRAAVPSGASTGSREAIELRDGDLTRFHGKGVLKAVHNINSVISPSLLNMSPFNQEAIDKFLIDLDGTPDKSNLGANALLGVSLAVAAAAAKAKSEPLFRYLGNSVTNILPVPMFNILNGGKHAMNSADFQEFMVVPIGASSYSDALRTGVEIYHSLRSVLVGRGLTTNVGDEGGFAPSLPTNKEAIEAILAAIENAGYKPGINCFIALDIAATEIYKNGNYYLQREGVILTSKEMTEYYTRLISEYPIISIEDGMAENDWHGWQMLMGKINSKIQIVGDDLYTSNTKLIQKGIKLNASNAVLIKLNQIGTLTETLNAISMAQDNNWGSIISHRSGETEDTTIADLAVATGAGQIKAGAPARSERVAKYNRLLRIEEKLGNQAKYGGINSYKHLSKDSPIFI